MAIQEGLLWAEDGERLYYRFQPGPTEKEPLLILHGHGEHSGRYLKFFSRLEDLGASIGIFDLRGCGRSSGERGDVARFEDYLSDVSSVLKFLELRFNVRPPIQLLGHSLGGLIATAWADKNPDKVSKLILSSPLFGIPKERWLGGLVKILDRWIPGLAVANPVNAFWLTHDAGELEKYRKDPAIRKRITIRLVHEMLKYGELFRTKQISLPFPVYILMAEEDYVVDPKATREFFARLKAPEKKLESFPGFFHEIFNEKEQDRVFERLRFYLSH